MNLNLLDAMRASIGLGGGCLGPDEVTEIGAVCGLDPTDTLYAIAALAEAQQVSLDWGGKVIVPPATYVA